MRGGRTRLAAALLLSCALSALALAEDDGAFRCDNGKQIPTSFVGDDFCDCGNDEADTGACPDTLYTCPNRPHLSTQVFSSRVNDGLCDCCDGSDEWRRPTLCPNTCLDLATRHLKVFERGARRKEELAKEGREASVRRKQQLESARAELQAAEPTLKALQVAKHAAEAQEARRRADREARIAAGEINHVLRLSELTSPMLQQAIARLALAKGVAGVDKLHDYLMTAEATSGLMGEVDSADLLELAMDARDTTPDTTPAEGSDGAETQTCAADGACGSPFESALIEMLPLASLSQETLRLLLSGLNELTGQTRLLAQVTQSLLAGSGPGIDAAEVAAALELLEDFSDAEADAARAALDAAAAVPVVALKTVRETEPVLALEPMFGAAHEWAHLQGQCFELSSELSVGKFAFKLCPFGAFTQDTHKLGNFEGWLPMPEGVVAAAQKREQLIYEQQVMSFGGGDQCDGTPRRAAVYFECAEDNALVSVSEPSPCVYSAWFRTPSACDVIELQRRQAALTRPA